LITHAIDKYEYFKNGPNFIHYDVEKKKYPTTDLDKMVGGLLRGEFSPKNKKRKAKSFGSGRQNMKLSFAKVA
jgi:hypothetical protein